MFQYDKQQTPAHTAYDRSVRLLELGLSFSANKLPLGRALLMSSFTNAFALNVNNSIDIT